MDSEPQPATESLSGKEQYEFKPSDSLKPRQIAHLVVMVVIITFIFGVLPMRRGSPALLSLGLLSTMYCFAGVLTYFGLRRLTRSSVTFDWDNQLIEFNRCFHAKRFLAIGAERVAQKQMSEVIRADESNSGGLRFLTVIFRDGNGQFSENYEQYERLRDRFDQLALANNHPELHVTMAQLKWRRFGLTIAIGLPLLAGVVAACVWFLNS